MKKKILIGIAVVLFIILVVWLFIPKYELTSVEKKKIHNEVLNHMDKLTNENVTFEDFQAVLGKNIANVVVAVGKDSYLRNKPSEKVISQYHLSELEEEQERLVKKVEDRYLNNLDYQIVDEIEDNNKLCEVIEIKTYYYALYLYDYIELTNSLLTFDIQDASVDDKASAEYYQAQLKALRVLDRHLDDYENITNEKETITVCYKNGEFADQNEAVTLNSALQGEMYSNMDFSNQDNVNLAHERLTKYLKEVEELT